MRILVAEDEQELNRLLRKRLKAAGYSVDGCMDGEEVWDYLAGAEYDALVLDIMMPKMDGWEVCRKIREKGNTPVIMLTAKGETFDKVLGLELGADDYVVKPFDSKEVVARIKAVLRRIHEQRDEKKNTELRIDNLEINMASFTVKLDGQVIACTPKEIEIIWCLASNPGLVFSREHLLQSIWGYDFLGDTRAVDSHIKRIRAKLCRDTNHWDIKTVWGVGYRFEMVS